MPMPVCARVSACACECTRVSACACVRLRRSSEVRNYLCCQRGRTCERERAPSLEVGRMPMLISVRVLMLISEHVLRRLISCHGVRGVRRCRLLLVPHVGAYAGR
eukprot:4817793-Pleurochrysis_carterae.AAC.3